MPRASKYVVCSTAVLSGLVVLACTQRQNLPRATVPSVAVSLSSAPVPPAPASTSASPSRVVASCIKSDETIRLTIDTPTQVTLCVPDTGHCHHVNLTTGVYTDAPDRPVEVPSEETDTPPPSYDRLSANRKFTIKTTKDTVRVCKVSEPSMCSSFTIKGYKPHRDAKTYATHGYLTATVSPDGQTAFVLLLDKGAGGYGATYATYDIASGRRLKSSVHPTDEFIDSLFWLHNRLVYTICVEAGPSCSAHVLDLSSRKDTSLDLNVYGATPPFLPVDEDTVAVVGGYGDLVRFLDMRTGTTSAEIEMPYSGYLDHAANIELRDGKLYIAYQSPAAGSIAVVDVVTRKVVHSVAPVPCPEAPEPP